jgi:hypothetical protein
VYTKNNNNNIEELLRVTAFAYAWQSGMCVWTATMLSFLQASPSTRTEQRQYTLHSPQQALNLRTWTMELEKATSSTRKERPTSISRVLIQESGACIPGLPLACWVDVISPLTLYFITPFLFFSSFSADFFVSHTQFLVIGAVRPISHDDTMIDRPATTIDNRELR